jgi:hypothetical protein
VGSVCSASLRRALRQRKQRQDGRRSLDAGSQHRPENPALMGLAVQKVVLSRTGFNDHALLRSRTPEGMNREMMMRMSFRSKQLFCLTGGFLLLPMIRALAPPFESSQVLSSQQRRSLVLGTISTLAAAAPALLTAANPRTPTKAVAGTDARVNANSLANPPILSTVEDVVQWIDTQCDKKFLHAVTASEYRFLYRGEDVITENPRILAPPPDLLLPGTYGTSEALSYFRTLEDIMKDEPVRPGNGHLATTSIIDATAWGPAVSVWPAAAGVDQHETGLAWLRDGGSFYPPRQQDDRNAVMASLVIIGKNCHEEQSLDDVLSSPHSEVMFSAPEFLAVPAQWDDLLRSRLRSAFLI